jgi:hypothetical protein
MEEKNEQNESEFLKFEMDHFKRIQVSFLQSEELNYISIKNRFWKNYQYQKEVILIH